MTGTGTTLFDTALGELGKVLARIDESQVDAACAMLAGAGKIAVYGCGREALQVKGFAMRLYHLGLPVSVVGDMTTPPLGKGDIFLVSSGPGETTTVLTLMKVARDAGATLLLLTAEAASSAAELADFTLLIPAQTMASDQGPAKDLRPADGLPVRRRAVPALRSDGAEAQGGYSARRLKPCAPVTPTWSRGDAL